MNLLAKNNEKQTNALKVFNVIKIDSECSNKLVR